MLKKNIANIITITRIIATAIMIKTDALSVAFYYVYIYAGLSDCLDGFVARKLKIESDLGSKLDSISDLFFFTTMMIKIWPYLVKYLPTYIWIVIWTIVGLRILLYVYTLISKHTLLSNHTLLNKTTGFLMFVLPFLVNSKAFVPYSAFTTLIALIAVIYELFLLFFNKKIDN